ncbi:MAG: hypothetical protein ABGZ23_29925 [Fuerstiella sp.]
MKQLITFATAIALLTVADPAFAQQDDKGKDEQRQGQQQDRGARRGGGQGQQQGRGARRGGGQGQQGRGRGGQGGGGGLFRLLDIDRDGNLSAKEINGAVAALMTLDANKDGILDAQELAVRGGGGRGGQGRDGGRGRQEGAENAPRRGGEQGNGDKGNRTAEN